MDDGRVGGLLGSVEGGFGQKWQRKSARAWSIGVRSGKIRRIADHKEEKLKERTSTSGQSLQILSTPSINYVRRYFEFTKIILILVREQQLRLQTVE